MNPTLFFENFDLLADAPNGVQKLRELILQLAVMGKLVPQDPNDEPATMLLQKIKAEKEELVKERKITKVEKLFPPKLAKDPYDLPKGWEWARIGDICWKLTDGSHNPPPKKDNGIPMLSSQNIENSKINFAVSRYITEEDYKQEKSRAPVEGGDVFLTIVGTIGRAAVVPGDMQPCAIQRSVALLGTKIYPYFLCAYLQSPVSHEFFKVHGKGTAQKGIYLNKVSLLHVPLPPLAEQKRIVSKVDELMALCDKLEARSQKKQEIQSKLNSVALDKMLSAENQEEFEQSWQRICENFDLLYDNSENVEKLKQAILQLAVQGKLVPQNPEDEPASVLIEKINNEKEKLAKEGKIKKNESFPEIGTEEISYDLPKGWEWIRLGNLCELITKGSSPKWQGVNYVEKSNGILFITSENVSNYTVNLDKEKYVEPKFNEIEPRSILKRNDLLMNIVGASIGRTAVFESEKIANINQAVCLIRIIGQNELLNLRYLLHFFNSPTCISYMFDKQVDNARANLSMGNISKFVIPIPPLAEQKRIVEKVEQFMGLCDELEAKLRKERGDSMKLMEAVVKGLSEGAATEKIELEKLLPLQVVVH